jgi:hypothetical protein
MEIEPVEAAAFALNKSGLGATVSKVGILAVPKGASALLVGMGTGIITGMLIATAGMYIISRLVDKADETENAAEPLL